MTPISYVQNKVFVKLKPSSYQGIGVFALRDIPKNTFLFEPWTGKSGIYELSDKELNTLPKELLKHIRDIFLYHPEFPSNNGSIIELTNGCHWIYTTPYYFVNSGFVDGYNLCKDTHKTIKDIKQGEEILSNYKRFEKTKSLI
tara:strand:- start:248 stop:676 length:429 start_codon:yes stop_codon:yes gene_type:complete